MTNKRLYRTRAFPRSIAYPRSTTSHHRKVMLGRLQVDDRQRGWASLLQNGRILLCRLTTGRGHTRCCAPGTTRWRSWPQRPPPLRPRPFSRATCRRRSPCGVLPNSGVSKRNRSRMLQACLQLQQRTLLNTMLLSPFHVVQTTAKTLELSIPLSSYSCHMCSSCEAWCGRLPKVLLNELANAGICGPDAKPSFGLPGAESPSTPDAGELDAELCIKAAAGAAVVRVHGHRLSLQLLKLKHDFSDPAEAAKWNPVATHVHRH